MGDLISPDILARRVDAIVAGSLLKSVADCISPSIGLLRAPKRMSTIECCEEYRLIPASEGGGLNRYKRSRTPYNVGPMDALDDPGCNLVVMVKPSRSGGTAVAENYLFKMMKFGPMGNVGWYLNSADSVKRYAELAIKPIFENHDDIAARVTKNNDTEKRFAGHLIEWLPANDSGFRNREPLYIVMDETDGWAKRYAQTPVINAKARQKQLGNRKKAIVMSHPDLGWKSGVSAAWVDTSRGIYIMRCTHCDGYAAAHATKYWDVEEFKLSYDRDTNAADDERLDLAAIRAGMACPHCGVIINDKDRHAMIDAGQWMHRGQSIDPDLGVTGTATPMTDRGFWVHGLMLKVASTADLARDFESALIKFERTGSPTQLREFMSKQLGEIYEGRAGGLSVNAASLLKRSTSERLLQVGECPADGKFITAAIDIGSGKFDLSFRAWDLEARSWWLDRVTIRQRRWKDGVTRDIRTRERIEDWDVLIEQAIKRLFPIIGRDGWAMPVALVTIDVGDGNVVWKGREFARRSLMAGHYWGTAQNPWPVVRLIQGSPNQKAPELPLVPTKISRDELGALVNPTILEYTLGVHKLKTLCVDRLGISDGGPGQCLFAEGISGAHFEEYFNETWGDNKWNRNGLNESLDLFAYEEAARLMIRPDRPDYDWSGTRLPPWAKPVWVGSEGDEAIKAVEAKPTQKSIFDRFTALNED